MRIIPFIKQHPVLSYCALVLVWWAVAGAVVLLSRQRLARPAVMAADMR